MEEIRLKKSLGQNFLTDKNIVNKIIGRADLDKETTVIEIGPGGGAMTEYLTQEAGQVIAIEIDQRLLNNLNKNYASDDFTLINEDFLNITSEDLLPLIKHKKVKVCANLPYYITTAIICKILLEMEFIDELYIMVQKEVGLRLTASERTKPYNSLSVFCQTICEVEYEFTVSRNVFTPVPNVDSAIVSFKRKPNVGDIAEFEDFVRKCFKQKRKILVNNLNAAYGFDKTRIIAFIESIGLTGNARSEEISVESFRILHDKFKEEFYGS